MMWMFNHPLISLCYGFLYLSVVLLWFPGKERFPRWSISLAIAILLGLFSRQLQFSALTWIAVLALGSYYSQNYTVKTTWRLAGIVAVLSVSLVLASHQLPGFNNLLAVDHVSLTPDAVPYTLYLNFDKAIIGIFILGFGPALLSNLSQLKLLVRKIYRKVLILLLILLNLAFMFGFIRFELKLPSSLLLWAITNLLFTCVAESALYFAFIQKKLALVMKENHLGNYSALIMAALIFALAHHNGGMKYMMLSLVAGLGYAWFYHYTKRIEASILAQFFVNLTHFIFFTYPALATGLV